MSLAEQMQSGCNILLFPSFKYENLVIKKSPVSKPKPDGSSIVFGREYTDHMFKVEWTSDGWSTPEITPLENLSLHPGAKVLHSANSLFEGMKAFRGVDGKVRLIRPEMNVKRMLCSAKRLAFPLFEGEEFIKCIKKLIEIDSDWVLPAETNCSLYVRPVMIATEPIVGGFLASNCGTLFVLLLPVGPYFTKKVPLNVLADASVVRAWPGGTGDCKLACNYAPPSLPQTLAAAKGFRQILWLFGPEHNLTESGSTNIFIAIEDKQDGVINLITPPLSDGLILPGVNRDSVIKLMPNWPEIRMIERNITMKEVQDAASDGRLLEMFGTGTAYGISPIGGIHFQGQQIDIPTPANGIAHKVSNLLTDIFYARVQHEFNRDVIC